MKILRASVVGACLLGGSASWGALPGESVSASGAGAVPCGNYLAASSSRTPQDTLIIAHWFAGYVTAYNHYSQDPQVRGALPNPNTIAAYFEKQCREAPLATLSIHADAFVKLLASRRP